MSKRENGLHIIPDDLRKEWAALSERQRNFITVYMTNGGNRTRAYAQAYGTEDDAVAASCGSSLLRTKKVWPVICGLLKAHQLTPEYIDLKLSEALEATVNKFRINKGKVISLGAVPDWDPRLRAAEMLNKVHGRYKGNGTPAAQPSRVMFVVNVNTKESISRIERMLDVDKEPEVAAADA